MPANSAEYQRAYRAKRKAENDPVPRGGVSTRETKFARGEFIAWDGEGVTTNDRIDDATYRHLYVMLANSVGDIAVNENGLRTRECFKLMLDCASNHPRAIHVVYGGSYDMNLIVRDLPKKKAAELAKHGSVWWKDYYIQFHPRRSLYVRKGDVAITLWDVIGFFQMKFEKAIEQWLGKDHPDAAIIAEGKRRRTEFSTADMDFMREYNDAELRALVGIMERFRDSVNSVNLSLSRWDGAGSVAAAILKSKNFKKSLPQDTPQQVELAARHAYFGGRFELGQYGIHEGKAYGYDINSAYPSVFATMPNLNSGRWVQIVEPSLNTVRTDNPFALYRIRWNLRGIRFGPFPYRDKRGLVLFPVNGENWVWGSELLAYLETVPDRPDWTVEVLDAWEFQHHSDELPFLWVEQFYQERQAIVNGNSSLPFGAQMVLKLGLNSLYGKTAQSLGYRPESKRLPPYHSLLYAGYITATTRAKLWKATMQAPEHIVMLATDGIITTTPLNLPISESKQLGFWEQTNYDLVCAIQSGVYITGNNGSFKFKKRGLDSEGGIEVFLERVREHWRNEETRFAKLPIEQTRLIGIKTACISDDFWDRWGCWYHHTHDLLMHPGPQTKRSRDKKSPHTTPHDGLVHTKPAQNILWDMMGLVSTPYERPWDRENWAWNDPEELHEIEDAHYA